jgi:predicted O-linked N-acetylglucosamine transferase (SPINDLY family)
MDMTTRQAFAFLQSGLTEKAAAMFEQALETAPGDGMALLGRGLALSALRRYEDALASLDEAIARDTAFQDAHIARSEALARLGRHREEAEALATAIALAGSPQPELLLRHASALRRAGEHAEAERRLQPLQNRFPDNPEIRHELGLVALEDSRYAAAVERFGALARRHPEMTEAWVNLCIAAKNDRQDELAICAGRRAVGTEPGLAACHLALANALRSANDRPAALDSYAEAIRLAPENAEALSGKGIVLMETGDLGGAIEALREAAKIAPQRTAILGNLSTALRLDRQYDAAIEIAEKAVELAPDSAENRNNLGNAFRDAGRLADAEYAYRQAISLRPGYAAAMGNLANLLRDMMRPDEALEMNEAAVKANPGDEIAGMKLLFGLCQNPDMSPVDLAEAHRDWARRFAPSAPAHGRPADPDPDRVIRVGFVSPDFRLHSLRYFYDALLAPAPREGFHLTAFAEVARPDRETEAVRARMDKWVSTAGLSRQGFADAVRRERIDILIDLAGHTANSRLDCFALRPAPVQVEWGAGYAFTTGIDAMDALIADATVVPPGTEDIYSEEIVRLPAAFTAYRPPRNAPPVAPLAAAANGFVTFGSISRTSKLNPALFDCWADILHEVPNSRLLLKDRHLGDEVLRDGVRRTFSLRGIDPSRLEFEGPSSHEATMAAYGRIDIALDPFPNSGGVTLCEAMWLGAPVIALEGNFFLSRVGASLIAAAGHPEWVARTPEEYVSIAAQLASDPDALAAIRRNLRDDLAASSLCDLESYGREVGTALIALWQRACAR